MSGNHSLRSLNSADDAFVSANLQHQRYNDRSTRSAVAGASSRMVSLFVLFPRCRRADATASRNASHTLMASMKGGSPTALLRKMVSSGLACGHSCTYKRAGTSAAVGTL